MRSHKYPTSLLQVRNLIRSPGGNQKRAKILQSLRLKDRTNLAKEYIQPALAAGLLEMNIPDKSRSSKKKYQLMDKGRELQEPMRQTR